MSEAHRVLGNVPTPTRKEPWWMELCRAGRHGWEVTAVVGLFACGRCGAVGTCAHYVGTLKGSEPFVCGAWCRRLELEGVQR